VDALRGGSGLDVEKLAGDVVNREASALVDLYLPRTTTQPLFHYTSLDGFAGMLASGKLWATHSGFLNDPTEVQYCSAILKAVVKNVVARAPERVGNFLRAYGEEIVRTAGEFSVYFTSFAEDDDLLSQWMAYTPSASGVSIGFDGATLSALPFVTLRKVLYDRRQQFRVLRALIRTYVAPLHEAFEAEDEERLATLGVMLGLLIHQCMLCFKNAAYAAEREWRLIVVMAQGAPFEQCVRYRVSSRALVPYLEIAVAGEGHLPITDVVLGPALDFNLNSISVGRFLKVHDIAVVPRASKVPFRARR
jgi:hypothetical protein